MSALATQLNFGMRISATDATGGAFKSAMQGLSSFARTAIKPITIPFKMAQGGLGFLRDINLGIAPVVRGLDNLIERGAGLEVVRKSFESLTGRSGKDTDKLARSIVAASSGTLRLAEAMQIANRAIGSGLSLEQLGTAIEFISKKAITTGKNANEALNTVITGLARGSTLFLDDFGILVDGVDGVRASFNKIKGAGAFDALGPAAQKAETIRQAIAEMQQQMGKIGVSGGETVFLFQGIKNAVGDSVDKLFQAAAKSESLRTALQGVWDVLAGAQIFLEKGGSIGDLLMGKSGGKSGGLIGFLKAGLLDLGETLGRGIAGSLLTVTGSIPGMLSSAWDKVKTGAPALWDGFKSKAGESWIELKGILDESFGGFGTTLSFLPEAIGDVFTDIIDSFKSLFSWFTDWVSKHIPGLGGGGSGAPASNTEFNEPQLIVPLSKAGGLSMNPMLAMRQVAVQSAVGIPFFDKMKAAGKSLLSGGILGGWGSRTGKWTDDFRGDFPGSAGATPLNALRPPAPFTELKLSRRGINDRYGQLTLIERERRKIAAQAERDARAQAGQEERRLRADGYIVERGDRDRIEKGIREQLINQRTAPLRDRAAAIDAQFKGSDARVEHESDLWKKFDKVVEAITQQNAQVGLLVGALMGDARGLAAIAAGRG